MKETTVPATQESKAADVRKEETRERARVLTPPVDIFEMADGLAVIVDLPGVDKDGAEVRVHDDTLTIKAEPKCECKGDRFYQEYELAGYFREFKLGDMVDQEKIQAEMRHGVLTIRLPKAEKSKPRQIPVKVA